MQFGIAGGMFCNELTWADVVVVLEGLRRYFAERRQYVAVVVFLSDEVRGPLGEASVDVL